MAKRGRTDDAAADAARALPDPQAPAPNLAPELGFTAQDLIDQQEQLEAEAEAAFPFQVERCTHALGALRQPVYACRTCGGGGVCAACSIMCHGDHELVELFHKRNFRCDCGTPSLYRERRDVDASGVPRDAKPCALRKHEASRGWDAPNDNAYSQNFQGRFCICERGKSYDAATEEEVRCTLTQTMYQCLVCEEWYHESCTALKEVRALPENFDGLICDACVQSPAAELLREYAGTRGWMLLAKDGPDVWDGLAAEAHGAWKLYGRGGDEGRGASDEGASESRPAKRARTCVAPDAVHPSVAHPHARTDVFLGDTFRARLCRCDACRARWAAYPYVYDEERTYEPPTDGDEVSSASSTYERAVAALGQLPRVQMLESLRAYQGLRDALYDHLRPTP
ncbi:RING-type E3 ubiquitin transferase [Malassezia obtusa]|uniref:RING-type E3 ubiquitin transferase n=1 Tax=Malassezia obtusa TaxID=76774 RepID=A0AAF0ITJ6_9BASI|nr:RING-type E3 ubiquitin transferase [Malassezia obtusa]